ncbi:hypothetical protein ABZ656_13890 [Streptomyces sp. NPDC007095]|uniref:hypothetical protein n=1 Tax=Streptomyces sp. NPDC007095 TaxID=3154482 RepID=UPI0034019494
MPYELHVRAALDQGIDADDLRELLRFISYDSGYPAAQPRWCDWLRSSASTACPDRPARATR